MPTVTSNLRAEGVKGQADAAAKTWSVAGGDEGNDGCVGGGCVGKALRDRRSDARPVKDACIART